MDLWLCNRRASQYPDAMTASTHLLHQGFSPRVEFDEQEAFSALLRDWPKLKPQLEEDACELQSNYLDAPPAAAATRSRIWDAMLEPTIRCLADGNYELTCRFTWQAAGDDHTVTFYVEDGEPRGSSIDG